MTGHPGPCSPGPGLVLTGFLSRGSSFAISLQEYHTFYWADFLGLSR